MVGVQIFSLKDRINVGRAAPGKLGPQFHGEVFPVPCCDKNAAEFEHRHAAVEEGLARQGKGAQLGKAGKGLFVHILKAFPKFSGQVGKNHGLVTKGQGRRHLPQKLPGQRVQGHGDGTALHLHKVGQGGTILGPNGQDFDNADGPCKELLVRLPGALQQGLQQGGSVLHILFPTSLRLPAIVRLLRLVPAAQHAYGKSECLMFHENPRLAKRACTMSLGARVCRGVHKNGSCSALACNAPVFLACPLPLL